MKKYISCKINGHSKKLQVESIPMPKLRGNRPKGWDEKIPTKSGNIWPWRYMSNGDVVRIPYKLANYYQIENSIKGFSKSRKGAIFHYRSNELFITVWCISKGDKKA